MINGKGFGGKSDGRIHIRNPKPHIDIIGLSLPDAEEARPEQRRTPDHHRIRMPPEIMPPCIEVSVEEAFSLEPLGALVNRRMHRPPGFFAQALVVIGGAPCQIRMLREHVALEGHFFGKPLVVGVKEGNPVAGGGHDAGIAGRTGPGVGLGDQPHLVAERPHHLHGVVRRAVIDHHNLIDRAGLSEHAVNRPPDVSGTVIRRNDGTDGQSLILFQYYKYLQKTGIDHNRNVIETHFVLPMGFFSIMRPTIPETPTVYSGRIARQRNSLTGPGRLKKMPR